MIVRKCDRCGKCYEPYRDNGKHTIAKDVNGIAFVNIDIKGNYTGRSIDGYDLCPECLKAVIDFMKNPEPETIHYFNGKAVKE